MTPNIIPTNFPNDKTVNTKTPTINRRMMLNLTPTFLDLTIKATKLTTTSNTNRSTRRLSKLIQNAFTKRLAVR